VWQAIYEELNDPNFVIISAAQDTGGEAVAGPLFDAAKATYVQLVDEGHVVSSAFNFVNVPSAAWIDEEGRIVRIDEGTYAKVHQFGDGEQAFQFGTDVYSPVLKDWVENGADSVYVQSAATVAGKVRAQGSDQSKADAAFRLGNLFRAHGAKEKAEHYWAMARSLNPDSINFFRQNLTLTEEGSGGETFRNLMGEYIGQGKPFYRPLNIESS
jgi:hypothetical protein